MVPAKKRQYLNEKQRKAVEMIATQPEIKNAVIAKELDVSERSVRRWRADPLFIDKSYERFMEVSGNMLPQVVRAMVREALSGNVRAGEIVLKHYGKLQDQLTINHKIQAPFMQFLESTKNPEEFDAAEIIDMDFSYLPERNVENDEQIKPKKKSFKAKKHDAQKKAQMERYHIRKRAKAVGLEVLPDKKPTQAARREWLKELERLEKEQE